MTVWKPSATSPEGLEVVPSVSVPVLLPNMRIEVPNTWRVVFSSQKGTLTVGPPEEVSLLALSSQVNSMTSSGT